jgi:hypothetical protein
MRTIEQSQAIILGGLGLAPSGDEWADYEAIAQTLARASFYTWKSAWAYLADQVLAGFKVDPQAVEAPTTQLMQWQGRRLAEDINGALERLRPWLEQTWASIKDTMDKIAQALTPPPGDDQADPPARRLEARNDNRPKAKHESPRWAPPTKRGRRR